MSSARRLAVSVVAIAASLLSAGIAQAGTATIYQCVGRAGQPVATDMLSAPPTSPAIKFFMQCGEPNYPFDIALRSIAPQPVWLGVSDRRELRIAGPPATLIVGGQIERQMADYLHSVDPATRSSGYGYRLSTAGGEHVLERCGIGDQPGGCQRSANGTFRFSDETLDLPTWLSTPMLRLSVGCFAASPACYEPRGQAGIDVNRLMLRVADLTAPAVLATAGSPVSDDPVRRRDLALTASDTGLGLYRVHTHVDGKLVDTQPFAAASRTCRDVEPRTPYPYEFASARACPTALSSASVRLANLPSDGEHALRVSVEDAAGNSTVVLDRTARFALPADELQCGRAGCVARRGAPNGLGASPGARLTLTRARTRLVPYGRRVAVSGRLRDPAGKPITGALIDVGGRTLRLDARPQATRQVRTGNDGSFQIVIPPGPSRVVRLGYRAHVGDARPARSATVRIRVRAAIRLALRPASVAPGQAVRVRGRVLGGPFPRGTFAELQALDGREWRTFKTLAVGRRGRVSYRYRFRHTTGPARFLWRVHVRAQAGLPYAAASSRAAWVLVR